mgnify:CR=1 FL=1
MKLPSEFEEKMKRLLGDEFPSYIACYEEPRYYGLRVNRFFQYCEKRAAPAL